MGCSLEDRVAKSLKRIVLHFHFGCHCWPDKITNRGGSQTEGVFLIRTCPSLVVLFGPSLNFLGFSPIFFWVFPIYPFPLSWPLAAPTQAIPERVRDVIRAFLENAGSPPLFGNPPAYLLSNRCEDFFLIWSFSLVSLLDSRKWLASRGGEAKGQSSAGEGGIDKSKGR